MIIRIDLVQANPMNQKRKQVSKIWQRKIATEGCASIFGHHTVSQNTYLIALFHFGPFANPFWHKKQSLFVLRCERLLKWLINRMGLQYIIAVSYALILPTILCLF